MFFSKFVSIATVLVASGQALPSLEDRQSGCPPIHIFGARETTASPGFGTAGVFINLIVGAYPSATTEAINYPATGGDSYGSSMRTGVANIANQINSFNQRCPQAKLVVVGYSQGAQISDNAICGGGDPNQGLTDTRALLTSAAGTAVKAIILAGNPRNSPAEKSVFGYGSCNAQGFSPRPAGFSCSTFAARIRSYCDAADPYCCTGNDAAAHQAYGRIYGQNALAFVKSKLG
ncbi:unnamed protein product [Zymoseptoria tritici ST99CH_3D1]|uniref:Acetyl xylan Esterase/Acetylesterase n=2 Tax=Zymoseptoria tritici TaxID=1047171 RepID=F9XDM8_ZYMTI|nr:acetyl xylan Esterase/Acetylesterase [Zymoseptoria tritici IPO323]EGP86520.1 acetyl xylan Esterase/Acetylesterase [Zymoseptoria tritici IPO323]SMR54209.1 unnamed protein product [Zymoseptoria tritici ST99CH_1E4]SMR56285.1 unnamed protein product [Zymoseptoria tritici ST99CH_3D1]